MLEGRQKAKYLIYSSYSKGNIVKEENILPVNNIDYIWCTINFLMYF